MLKFIKKYISSLLEKECKKGYEVYDIESITVVVGKYIRRDVTALRNSENFKEFAKKIDKIIGDK